MKFFKSVLIIISIFPVAAIAAGASNEWSDGYNFKSAQDKQVILLQADLIERMENDYYNNIGKSTTYSTINVDNRQGNFIGDSSGESNVSGITYTTTNTIGSVNNTNNNVDINGNNNAVSTTTSSSSNGNQNGAVLIDSKYRDLSTYTNETYNSTIPPQ
ncbi:hypothetical protein MCERHM32_00635 [Methylophilaceae bacterium]